MKKEFGINHFLVVYNNFVKNWFALGNYAC